MKVLWLLDLSRATGPCNLSLCCEAHVTGNGLELGKGSFTPFSYVKQRRVLCPVPSWSSVSFLAQLPLSQAFWAGVVLFFMYSLLICLILFEAPV